LGNITFITHPESEEMFPREDDTGCLKTLCAPGDYSTKNTQIKMATTEYIRNVDRAILNTVFENTVRRVNTCLGTGGGHFEHYL
jgi:hypothetical protein